MRQKYANAQLRWMHSLRKLRLFWDKKLSRAPDPNAQRGHERADQYLDAVSKRDQRDLLAPFPSFIEVGGRTGLGYRDTCAGRDVRAAQQPRQVPGAHRGAAPRGDTSGLRAASLRAALVCAGTKTAELPLADRDPPCRIARASCTASRDACSDDALWLVVSVAQYIKETGDFAFADEIVTYADGGEESVYDHLKRILNFSAEQVGQKRHLQGAPRGLERLLESRRRRKRDGELFALLGAGSLRPARGKARQERGRGPITAP